MPQESGESATDRVVRKTPWWAISMGMHLTLALVLGWIVVLGRTAESDSGVECGLRPPPPQPPEFFRDDGPKDRNVNVEVKNPTEEVKKDANTEDPKPTTPDDEMFGKEKGDLNSADKPFRKEDYGDRIGAGGDTGGRRGGPLGDRVNRGKGRKGPGPTRETEDAVRRALLWLARHQDPDGPWRVQGFLARCRNGSCVPNPDTASAEFDVGVTGLALLAFLGAGYSHASRDIVDGVAFGDVVRRGLQWVLAQQDDDGCIGSRLEHKYMYGHAIAALALTEACCLTNTQLFRDRAQKAVEFLVSAQNPELAWRYSRRSGENDTSVTGWAVMVFKSARMAGLEFPASVYDGVRAWLDSATEPDYYRTGYHQKGTGKVYCAHNQAFDHHEALSAIAAMSRIFMDRDPNDPRVAGACALLARDLPSLEPMAVDYYYWYYASLALHQYDGHRNGPVWQKWNKALTDSLVKSQNLTSTGCKSGSWEPADRWSCEGGRVYATAINALTLEVYYRYPFVFGSR